MTTAQSLPAFHDLDTLESIDQVCCRMSLNLCCLMLPQVQTEVRNFWKDHRGGEEPFSSRHSRVHAVTEDANLDHLVSMASPGFLHCVNCVRQSR